MTAEDSAPTTRRTHESRVRLKLLFLSEGQPAVLILPTSGISTPLVFNGVAV